MSSEISVLSWNLQGEIGIDADRLQRQLDWLEEHAADVDCFLLQAVNAGDGSPERWEGHLGGLLEFFESRDYHTVHTGDWACELADSEVQPHAGITGPHNRCNLTATRWPNSRRPLSLRNYGDGKPRRLNYYYTHFPEKLLVSEIGLSTASQHRPDSLEVWNVGIINGAGWGEEKLNMLETVYARVHLQTSKTDSPVVLGGDFNASKKERADGTIIPHGTNAGQYTDYPFYGDPHYFRDDGEKGEYRFDQRWKRAEARIFDKSVGDWGMRDVYWEVESSRRAASTEDYSHVIDNATPSEKRLDHILVSDEFEVISAEIWNGVNGSPGGFVASDHAPVYSELRLD